MTTPAPEATAPEATDSCPCAPTVGAATPLSAAYCAERAALLIHRAQSEPTGDDCQRLLRCADRWTALGAAMSDHLAMCQRPPDRDTDRRT